MDVVTYALCKKLAKKAGGATMVATQQELEQYIADHTSELVPGQTFFITQPEVKEYVWDGQELKSTCDAFTVEDVLEVFQYLFGEEIGYYFGDGQYLYTNENGNILTFDTSWEEQNGSLLKISKGYTITEPISQVDNLLKIGV